MKRIEKVVSLRDGFSLHIGTGYAVYRGENLFGETPAASLEAYFRYTARSNQGCGIVKAKLLVTGACNQRCYYCSVAADWSKGT